MKATAILAIVMFVLLIAAVSGLAWQSHKREQAEKSLTGTQEELKQTGDVLTEVRALRRDVSLVEAGLKKLNQQRTATGEHRRENIKTALAGNDCAVAPLPAAGADSLYQRAEEVSAADYSGALARKPDGKN
ncbi:MULTISPECIES: DUF2570 domain-containing protein [Klebsiella]|uniref:DUF2570 domain-containing protein n=1 Tax=Klebsiella TaxID=570 RepID=UPI0015E50881|nr:MULTISPECIES: DUF2570 domain-containing protein [Klebsiella]HBR8416442.1 DUF2570 domain-containing protein [Klebsiella pneumoniae subsp. pneumoniae]MDM4566959.1 DUF2570 domain-containing protein [Klebsiella michiganensis]MDM4583327.1 DUF2570 domain-containing protein [Klebsiella michiganensis]MDO7076125.1 DUF2570 domain-containing protein [Klebsiella pneumoniae]MDS7893268.1 DUF2570 domain-containing protein [Klebsiella michiganensis]